MATVSRAIRPALQCLCLLLLLTGCASPVTAKRAVDTRARTAADGRALLISVPQAEIQANIEVTNLGAMAIGMSGMLLDAGVNQMRANAAEESIVPLRNALLGFDFDRRALKAAQSAFSAIAWLGVRDDQVWFTKDISDERLQRALDLARTPQLLAVHFSYEVNRDASRLTTGWTVSLLSKAVPVGAGRVARLAPEHLAYHQQFACLATLARPSTDTDANVRRWAAQQASAARSAIDGCLAHVAATSRQSLDMTPAARAALRQAPLASLHGASGHLIARTGDGPLLLDEADRWLLVHERGFGT